MTPEVAAQICRTIAVIGAYPDTAAEAVGVSKSTMRSHRRRHPEFATAIKKAQAEAMNRLLARIWKASENPKFWTAAAWILERVFPQFFARIEVRPMKEGEVTRTASNLLLEALATMPTVAGMVGSPGTELEFAL